MLRLAPLTDSFRIPYAWDDALDHGDISTEEGIAAFEARYAQCLETLDFRPLVVEGQDPTWFVFRPVRMSELRALFGLVSGEPMKLNWLIVRVALQRIDNGGEVKLERKTDPRYIELGPLITVQTMDVLENLSLGVGRRLGELVDMFADAVHARSTRISGK